MGSIDTRYLPDTEKRLTYLTSISYLWWTFSVTRNVFEKKLISFSDRGLDYFTIFKR
jgi:hypothetical protein